MVAIAPRLPPRLLDEIERLARRRIPIAEINRLAGATATRMHVYKPSYETVLVHAARRLPRTATALPPASVALDIAFAAKTPWALLDRLWAPAGRRRGDRAPPRA